MPSRDVTALLKAWADGDAAALERLIPLVYRELHRIARLWMVAERTGHSLQATALINETYLRLGGVAHIDWQDRSHFFAMMSRLMRRVLVDIARAKRYQKRGGGAVKVSLDEDLAVAEEPRPDLFELDLALQALAAIDARKSRVVELRYFGGLNVEETAEAIGVSPETVHRDWRLAKAWLRRELRRGLADGR